MTNLVQFPGLGLSFELNRVAFSIGGFSIYWYGVCIAFGICLALVFAFRHSIEFGVDPDSMVDVILIGIVLGIVSARAYYVVMAPFKYESIWEMIAIRDGGLAIYGGIIGGFLFGGLACKWRGVPVLPLVDLIYADLKLMDGGLHRKHTGVRNERILSNLEALLTGPLQKRLILRTPLIPGITATEENLWAIATWIAGRNPAVRWELLNYNPLAAAKYPLVGRRYCFADNPKRFSAEQMAAFAELARIAGAENVFYE